MADHTTAIDAHYGSELLGETLLANLRTAEKDPDALRPDDLAAIDQFHTGGQGSTRELARLAALQPGWRVLDVGGGLGGPARTLAQEFGCAVTVLDVTRTFCEAGEMLTQRTRLADRVTFRHGDALGMPFADGAFDVVWTQHVSMNVSDKARLYQEAHRVLRPDGRLALHEVVAGDGSPLHFPVPWARELGISFLLPAAEFRALLAAAGFAERAWIDATSEALAWFRRIVAGLAARPTPPPLGLHLVMGPEFGEMVGNLLRNLAEGRVGVMMTVLDRA